MKKQIAIATLLGTMALVSVGCGKADAEEVKTSVELKTQTVQTIAVNKSSIDRNVTYNGTLSAINTIKLASAVPGEILSVPVKVGDNVSKDQPLYILDKKDIKRAADNARLQYEAANHQLATVRDQHTLAKKNFERVKALYDESKGSAVSQADYEQAEKAASSSGVSASKTQVARSKIGMDQAADQLKDADLQSPIEGIVTLLNVEPGQSVGSGQHIATVINIDQVYVDIQVSETLVNTLKPGMTIETQVPAVSSEQLSATIEWVSPAADAQTRLFPVRVVFDNPDHLIKPGMFATISISVNEAANEIVIPSTAVLQRVDRQIVFVNIDGVAEEKEIITGFDNGRSIVVLSGLSVGDQLIVEGQQFVETGTPLVLGGGE
jgi:RND family efflux transporter MFP subunit